LQIRAAHAEQGKDRRLSRDARECVEEGIIRPENHTRTEDCHSIKHFFDQDFPDASSSNIREVRRRIRTQTRNMDQPLGSCLSRLPGNMQGPLSVDRVERRPTFLNIMTDGIDYRSRLFHGLGNR
jgi:hypothetical protein